MNPYYVPGTTNQMLRDRMTHTWHLLLSSLNASRREGKHKVQSGKCYNKVMYRDKMREQVLLFRLGGEAFTNWQQLRGVRQRVE